MRQMYNAVRMSPEAIRGQFFSTASAAARLAMTSPLGAADDLVGDVREAVADGPGV
jgi:hypothetical protein